MEKKREIAMNLAVVAAVVLLALAAFLLPRLLPARDLTPNAGTIEDAGFVFTPDSPAE